jgi:hypothetical protein
VAAAARQEFAGGVFLLPLLGNHALDQFVDGVLGTKPRDRHQLTVAWHTFVAPIEGSDVGEMLL